MSQEPSEAKKAANRRNAQKSTGPGDTSSTRHNATRHGLLAEGVTELDNPAAFVETRSRLVAEMQPVGEVEIFLVHRIALCMARLKRADLLEAEFITEALHPQSKAHPPPTPPPEGDPGRPARLPQYKVYALGDTYQRYETAIENKLYRALNQLERLQRMRGGERIPPPVSVNIGVETS